MANNFITPEQAVSDILNTRLSEEVMLMFDKAFKGNDTWANLTQEDMRKSAIYMALGGQLKGLNYGST